MEIPYIVNPRKDTGLTNSKIAIWLFLASEVMLFGGLFSAYIFLRVYADYPWPERALPVLPGLINTFILIASSVTVVMAWASLKLRELTKFRIYMSITVLCAGLFMVLKGMEYNAKFHHQAVRLNDYAVVEGHLHPHEGLKGTEITIEAETVSIDLFKFSKSYYADFSAEWDGKLQLEKALVVDGEEIFPAGQAISVDMLSQAKELFINNRANNAEILEDKLRQSWKFAKEETPGENNRNAERKKLQNDKYKELVDAIPAGDLKTAVGSLTFKATSPIALHIDPKKIYKSASDKEGDSGSIVLNDGTTLAGTMGNSDIVLDVDAISFRHTVMQAEKMGIDPEAAIANSWLLKDEGIKTLWDNHLIVVEKLEQHLLEEYKTKTDANGNEVAKRVPTEADRYRMGWKEIVALEELQKAGKDLHDLTHQEIQDAYPSMTAGFTGADHKSGKYNFPKLTIPREQVLFESKFTPAWNNYYAIYFTMTGLHGLHVIGGAIVLAYYLFFGTGMYRKNPEWLANRVEVGGLFWHFVDLVWIFLFPIMYLM
ncbi:cytochrome c oxidase subunit 3 [Persicirhabdus sediminis]|uniref:Heme-copper oxidase subunit III n=1 Tax=Persicirhabdus sediminis TaxID=454144 RepID=A0A8J7SI88_9BACT|nr:cytochrome c oxidase subunit 3 [Persicirhabdus sediminis]MBK1790394.1 heme-copper oxidase subunit III [Persicirhabdus sediminis]